MTKLLPLPDGGALLATNSRQPSAISRSGGRNANCPRYSLNPHVDRYARGWQKAQEPASDSLLTVNHYQDMEGVSDPQLSPDGTQILYTRRWVNKLEDKFESAIWAMRADGSHNRLLVKGSSPRWSPDGSRILYVADGEPKGAQIFVRWMDA